MNFFYVSYCIILYCVVLKVQHLIKIDNENFKKLIRKIVYTKNNLNVPKWEKVLGNPEDGRRYSGIPGHSDVVGYPHHRRCIQESWDT